MIQLDCMKNKREKTKKMNVRIKLVGPVVKNGRTNRLHNVRAQNNVAILWLEYIQNMAYSEIVMH